MFSGVLPLYKPRGMTSHDCIYRLRKLLHMKKIGHTGTLDPEVDGVLPICLGKATRIAQFLTVDSKVYEGVIRLGTATTTEDATGEVVEGKTVTDRWSRAEIEAVFTTFVGEITQVPPMYSAVKVKGKKLYEYARAGIKVERPSRQVTIFELALNTDGEAFSKDLPFVVYCSKGTYVRTLAVDIGKKLGYPAHLFSLTRTRSGAFDIGDCLSFADIEQAIEQERFASLLTPIHEALKEMPRLNVDEATAQQVMNGAVLNKPNDFKNQLYTVYNNHGECLAIYKQHPTKPHLIKPERVLSN
ncbi:tRNA pseudouridine synthase B [Pullulanibacillus camelliae]|uniref:tRNA pseudouridine synthase B n=1 Tax=Pullulanibacillus camelliae TaxID=1707096 RepID=A0A8J2YJ68_9BACL|nr:tRNA pseudouridine(55) synthase TruB [Pullulanibacillus camelliae]GGE46185.1 tRNA pseudouridine synthase B [Pullulanibacillus camelliae]